MSDSMPTQIPVDTMGADRLPPARAWNYKDIAAVVGNLYLETHKQTSLMEEQFGAIVKEYQQRISQHEQENSALKVEITRLRRELERRNEVGASTSSNTGK